MPQWWNIWIQLGPFIGGPPTVKLGELQERPLKVNLQLILLRRIFYFVLRRRNNMKLSNKRVQRLTGEFLSQ